MSFNVSGHYEVPDQEVGHVFDVVSDSALWQDLRIEGAGYSVDISCEAGGLAIGRSLSFDVQLPMVRSRMEGGVTEIVDGEMIGLQMTGKTSALRMEFLFGRLTDQLGTTIDQSTEVQLRGPRLAAFALEKGLKGFVRQNLETSFAPRLVQTISDASKLRAARSPKQRAS